MTNLDDDLDSDQLIQFAAARSHRLISPRSVGNRGIHDALHFLFAVSGGHPVLTRNAGDFRALHRFALGVGGNHAGLIIVYDEADRRKNMRPHEIVAAIGNLDAAKVQLANQLIALNHFR